MPINVLISVSRISLAMSKEGWWGQVQSASIKHGSWFHQSNLTLHEIMLITYDIVHREQALHTQSEYEG